MFKIEKISNHIFENEKSKLNLIIGEYATYNEYYLVDIFLDSHKIKIGLQIITGGILPNIIINNNKILITAGQFFYILDKNCDIINKYYCYASIFEMKMLSNYLVVYNEMDIMCFDNDINLLWKREFDGLIDIDLINEDLIKLTCNNEDVIINLNDDFSKFSNS